jgi:hypothetical protein
MDLFPFADYHDPELENRHKDMQALRRVYPQPELLQCNGKLKEPFVSAQAWTRFVQLVRENSIQLPWILASADIAISHLRKTTAIGISFRQQCQLTIRGTIQTATDPVSLQQCSRQVCNFELPIAPNATLFYDLELAVDPCVVGFAEVYIRQFQDSHREDHLLDVVLLKQGKAVLLLQGLPLAAFEPQSRRIRVNLCLALGSQNLHLRAEWHAAVLQVNYIRTNSLQQEHCNALGSTLIMVPAPPRRVVHQANLLMVWHGRCITHVVGGDFGAFDHSQPSDMVLFAREFMPVLTDDKPEHSANCACCENGLAKLLGGSSLNY